MAANLLNLSCDEPIPLEESSSFSSIQQIQQAQMASGPRSKREMSRQQWEMVRPTIQRVYIDENQSFNYLAHILRTEHDFQPTYV